MKIYIIGVGPAVEDYILPIAKSRIERADCLVGAKRVVRLFRHLGKEEVLIEGHFNKVMPYIKRYKNKKKIAILVSGDPGMYSLLEKISKALKPQEYVVIPGISTVQLAFARIGQSWHDANILSLHGRRIDNLISQIKPRNKVFLFTDPDFPPDKIARRLLKEGLDNRRAVVLENLAYPDEKITDTDLRRLSRMKGFGLCAMVIESQKHKADNGKLYGIGIGPGDPKLVTLKAKEILDRIDTIFVPKSKEDGASWARSIVADITTTQKTFLELTFPMTKDETILNRYWGRAANRIAKEINKTGEAAFVTIGDPFIYSTYVYLLKTLRQNFPNIKVETIPGVSAFSAAASASDFPLVTGDQRLAIVPVINDLRSLREALKEFDTIVLMKVGSRLNRVISLLKELGLIRCAVLVSRVGHRDEKIVHDLASLRDKKIGYLSVIIVKKGRTG